MWLRLSQASSDTDELHFQAGIDEANKAGLEGDAFLLVSCMISKAVVMENVGYPRAGIRTDDTLMMSQAIKTYAKLE